MKMGNLFFASYYCSLFSARRISYIMNSTRDMQEAPTSSPTKPPISANISLNEYNSLCLLLCRLVDVDFELKERTSKK